MKGIRWQEITARKADLQKSVQFSFGLGSEFYKIFKITPLRHQLYYFDHRTTTFYFDETEYNNLIDSFARKFNKREFIKQFQKFVIQRFLKFLKRGEKIFKHLKPELSTKDLFLLHQQFQELWHFSYPMAWSLFLLTPVVEKIKMQLAKYLKSESRANDVINIISQPSIITPVIAAEIEILKLAKILARTNNQNTIIKEAEQLSQKFGWMSVYNFTDKPRTAHYYIREAQKIIKQKINIEKTLHKIRRDKILNENKFQKILKLIKNNLLKNQLKFLHIAGYLREMREEARDRLTVIHSLIYQRLAQKLNISINDVIFLTTDEINLLINQPNKRSELLNLSRTRQRQYILFIDNGKLLVYSQNHDIKKWRKILSPKQPLRTINGQIACKTAKLIKGIVKVVLSNKELGKVNAKNILVCTMTKPDYVPAIKIVAAIITDEGGLLSHAAIISRELKKPCIIGTKIATKVLKDGDLVEVDAERGIVKILKKVK